MEDEYIFLSEPIQYIINNMKIPIVQGNKVINFIDYLPILKNGFTKYNTILNILSIYPKFVGLDYKNIKLYHDAFTMFSVSYVVIDGQKMTLNNAIKKRLIEEPINSYQFVEYITNNGYDLEDLLYFNYTDDFQLNTKIKYHIDIESNYEQNLSVLLSFNDIMNEIPLETLVNHSGSDLIEKMLKDNHIKLYVAIILGNEKLVNNFLKKIDPRTDNYEAYKLALKYENQEIINLIKKDIVRRDWLENQMFYNTIDNQYGTVRNDIQSYYKKYI